MRGVGGGAGIFLEISEKFSGNFREISGKCVMIRKREIDLVNREIKIFTKGLQKNNPGIKLSSSIKYLRKCNFPSRVHVFSTSLILCWVPLQHTIYVGYHYPTYMG